MSAVPEFEFRTSSVCKYDNSDPHCVEVATNVPGGVADLDFETGGTVEFTAVERTDFPGRCQAG